MEVEALCDSHKELKDQISQEYATVKFQVARLIMPVVYHFNESSSRVLKVNKTESFTSILKRTGISFHSYLVEVNG